MVVCFLLYFVCVCVCVCVSVCRFACRRPCCCRLLVFVVGFSLLGSYVFVVGWRDGLLHLSLSFHVDVKV